MTAEIIKQLSKKGIMQITLMESSEPVTTQCNGK